MYVVPAKWNPELRPTCNLPGSRHNRPVLTLRHSTSALKEQVKKLPSQRVNGEVLK